MVFFQNACGISINAFVDLLAYYLRATYASLESNLLLEKYVVCIGSSAASNLADIFIVL